VLLQRANSFQSQKVGADRAVGASPGFAASEETLKRGLPNARRIGGGDQTAAPMGQKRAGHAAL
jgi:hypothetical protein